MVACGVVKRLFGTQILAALTVAVVLILGSAGGAWASTDSILSDCNDDGVLSGNYSAGDLKNALGNIPSDLQQYSNCESVIRQALLKKVTKNPSPSLKGGKAKGKSASVNALTTPKQRAKIRAQVEDLATSSPSDPLVSAANPAIQQAAGNTLTSTKSPSVPIALVIAAMGLLLLFAIDLAGRLGKIPRVRSLLPQKLGRRGGD